jgi:methionine sulfoxide reductase heme-binding subunit
VIPAATAAGPHVFWITSRAAGSAALLLSSGAVCAGLLVGNRGASRRQLGGADAKALHEALSLATIAAIALHGISLLGDQFLHPSVFEISIPFIGAYRPLWTGVGIAAGWGLALLGLSYYARSWVGQSRWRSLHRFTALFWALGIVHTLGSGTDAGQLWFIALLVLTAAPALILLAARLSGAQTAGEPSTRWRNEASSRPPSSRAAASPAGSSLGPPVTSTTSVAGKL